MKRSELVEGQDYLAARSTDWQRYGGTRVRVLNAVTNLYKPHLYRQATDADLREVAAVTSPGGEPTTVKAFVREQTLNAPHTHVLVALVNDDGTLSQPVLRSTRELRATWERGCQIVAERDAARQARLVQQREQDKAQERRLWAIQNRLATVVDKPVLERIDRQRTSARRGYITISLDDLEMILDGARITDENPED